MDGLRVSRILHAGYVFEAAGASIAFDPIFENPFSRNCHAFPDVCFDRERIRQQRFDAVFISHFHDDHCSLESLDLLDRATPIHMYCVHPEFFALIRELGFSEVHSLTLDRSVEVGPFLVTPRRALDREVDSLFQVRAGGLNILNVVDSWIDETTMDLLARESPWDLILWPFQTMREVEVLAPRHAGVASRQLPPEWIDQLRRLGPRFVVPSSCQFIQEEWSWFRQAYFPITYAQFRIEVEAAVPGCRVVRMNPSVGVDLTRGDLSFAEGLSWVHPVGEQDVDYIYDPARTPSPTAEVAKHFPPLTVMQLERVLHFCRRELPEKLRRLGPPDEVYFRKRRRWRLSIYDEQGASTHFDYRIDDEDIELAVPFGELLGWTTEVPASKLYAALEGGETLTSMYLRVENESGDPLNDPLVRALSADSISTYQKNQLKWLQQATAGSD